MNKRIIIWSKSIDDLLNCEPFFGGGVTVQLYFWAETFISNGWQVFTFSKKKHSIIRNIRFVKFPNNKYASIFADLLFSLYHILKIRPNIIFIRGASRITSYLALFSKLTCTKLVFLSANDINFVKDKENISGMTHNTKMYRWGLKYIDYFIVQNEFQKQTLLKEYNKNCIIIPNIWIHKCNNESEDKSHKPLLWVTNFRRHKRPDWYINLAKKFQSQFFLMIGASIDNEIYLKSESEADKIPNLRFTGGIPFEQTNDFFSQVKILICTSEYEGFPNTFLQAWANNIPVISTVDPSNVINNFKLGLIVSTEDELFAATKKLISDKELYLEIQRNTKKYFTLNHDCQTQFERMMDYLNNN